MVATRPNPSRLPQRQAPCFRALPSVAGAHPAPPACIRDPNDPRGLEPGEVLVCAITDPSWTPLFLTAAAVVCDSGAVQSHAAIVARELGIPAVLSVPAITAVGDGTMLHVDGDAGTVASRLTPPDQPSSMPDAFRPHMRSVRSIVESDVSFCIARSVCSDVVRWRSWRRGLVGQRGLVQSPASFVRHAGRWFVDLVERVRH